MPWEGHQHINEINTLRRKERLCSYRKEDGLELNLEHAGVSCGEDESDLGKNN